MRAAYYFWTAVISVVSIVAAVYAIYKIRRTTEENRQRSDERATAMLMMLHKDSLQRGAQGNGAATAIVARIPAPPPAPPSTLVRRPRILTDNQRLLYLVLRSAMPDHTVMAHVRIVDLLDLPDSAAAIDRDARLRELLRERLDFVVCNNDLVPVAAVVLYDSVGENVPDEGIKVETLRALGVRFLRFRADSLPRPAEIRSLVLG